MKTLKVNQIEKNRLTGKTMSQVTGGAGHCGCSCYYEGKGGSDTGDNYSANNASDLVSINGEIVMSQGLK